MYYVYEHIRLDTNAIFYVGKGSNDRMYVKQHRNDYWNNVVNKAGGFTTKKLIETEDEQFAFFVESETIDLYKKRGIQLTNLTSGGEGGSNPSEETRQKMSESRSGEKNPRYSYNSLRQKRLRGEILHTPKDVMRENMRKNHWSKTGKYSPPKGIKFSEEIKQKMRGKRKSMTGNNNPKSKIVIYSDKKFACIKDFATFLNVNYKTLVVKIRGIKRNVFTTDDFDSLTNGSTYFNKVKNERNQS
jgi:hypothetical protein